MSWMKNKALETRTFGEAAEDARQDRRDGLTSAPRRYRSGGYQFSRRSREEWAALESEASKQARERIAAEAAAIRASKQALP
jgi:hypothetical protein